MITISLHPCDVGDLPEFIQLCRCFQHLPFDDSTIKRNWQSRYSEFVERRKSGGLWVDVRAADHWLDARGKKLLSHGLLVDKRRRNPGWEPAGNRLEALVSTQDKIIQKIAELVALKLHLNPTEIAKFAGGAA